MDDKTYSIIIKNKQNGRVVKTLTSKGLETTMKIIELLRELATDDDSEKDFKSELEKVCIEEKSQKNPKE